MAQIQHPRKRPLQLKRHICMLTLLWTLAILLSFALVARRGMQEIGERVHYQAIVMGDKVLDDIAGISQTMPPPSSLTSPLNLTVEDDTTETIRDYLAALRSQTVFSHDTILSRSHIKAHLAAPVPVNRQNSLTHWDLKGMQAFWSGAPELASELTFATLRRRDSIYHMTRPVRLEQSCLACHNAPGRRPGTLYGVITVDVPLHDFLRVQQEALAATVLGHGGIWLVGMIGIYLMALSLRRRIRERDRSQRMLQQERDFVSKVIDTGNIIVIVTDRQGAIVRFNPVGERVTGRAAGELAGKTLLESGLLPPEDAGRLSAAIQEIAAGRVNPMENDSLESGLLASGGERRIYAWSTAVIPGKDGAPAYVVCKGIDITDRRRMEEAMRASEEKFRNLFESCSDAIFIADAENGLIIEANRAAECLAGLPREALIGMHPAHLHLPEEEALVRQLFEAQSHHTASQRHTGFIQRADGESVPVEIATSTFTIAGRDFAQGVFRDISERRHAEAERQRLEEKVLHTQKLESLGVLAGGIAHDFNNLLMGVLGYADLALLELPREAPARYNIQQIVTASLRAADLTRQMLAYSGKGKFVIETLDLSRLVEEMTHLLQISISKKAILRFNIVKDLPPIEGDATQIRQVVMNLITNASDAIGEQSGLITINTGMMEVDRSYLDSTFMDNNLTEGFYTYLEVSDTGCGMDAETRAKIFDPFFTTKFTGRGLGLAAVLGIVRGHHGGIKVYSETGHGTTFKVFFPCKVEAVPLPEPAAEDARDWRGQGTVLVVDDEETVRAVGKMTLETAGFKVLTAGDGREALEIFHATPDEILLVLLDMTMPHMNGEETFRELRRLRPDVRIILSSGYNEQEATNRFVGKGLSGFIQKPYRSRDLLDKVTRLFQPNPQVDA